MYGAKHPVEDGRMNWSLGGFSDPWICVPRFAFFLPPALGFFTYRPMGGTWM